MSNTDIPDVDGEFTRCLADALAAEAVSIDPPAGAWETFTGRQPDHHPGRGSAPTHRWRVPLIAAAAVIAIAVGVTAVVAGHRASGPASGSGAPSCNPAAPAGVSVPVITGHEDYVAAEGTAAGAGPADGNADGEGSSGVPTPSAGVTAPPATTEANSDATVPSSSDPAEPRPTITMSFSADPPAGALCVRTAGHPVPATVISDGTPLGYLALETVGGESYLVMALGPAVEQVQIQAMPPDYLGGGGHAAPPELSAVTAAIDPGFDGGSSAMWTIDGGQGTPWSLPEAADGVWTEVETGWHGVVVAIPDGTQTVAANALGSSGQVVQVRVVDLTTGRSTDGPVPTATTPVTVETFGDGPPASGAGSSNGNPPALVTVNGPVSPTSTSAASTSPPRSTTRRASHPMTTRAIGAGPSTVTREPPG